MTIPPQVIAAGIQTAGNLLGGIMGKSSRLDQLTGLKEQLGIQLGADMERARDLPEHMVKGFKKAGIHPLYGMGGGANLGSQMPSFLGGDNHKGDFIREMGQGVSRAISASQDAQTQKIIQQGALLDLERKKLENEHIRQTINASSVRLANTARVPPISGGGNPLDGNVEFVASKQESSHPDLRGTVASSNPTWQKYKGNVIPIWGPNAQTPAEAMEGIGGTVLMLPQMALDGILSTVRDNWRMKKKMYKRWFK